MTHHVHTTAWVDADGSYGEGDLIVFNSDALTDEQWDVMTEMNDNDRFSYVQAILNGDLETVAQYHEQYEVN